MLAEILQHHCNTDLVQRNEKLDDEMTVDVEPAPCEVVRSSMQSGSRVVGIANVGKRHKLLQRAQKLAEQPHLNAKTPDEKVKAAASTVARFGGEGGVDLSKMVIVATTRFWLS